MLVFISDPKLDAALSRWIGRVCHLFVSLYSALCLAYRMDKGGKHRVFPARYGVTSTCIIHLQRFIAQCSIRNTSVDSLIDRKIE